MPNSNGFRLGRMITREPFEQAEQREYERYLSGSGSDVGETESSRPSQSRNPAKCANPFCGSWITEGGRKLGRCEVCGTTDLFTA